MPPNRNRNLFHGFPLPEHYYETNYLSKAEHLSLGREIDTYLQGVNDWVSLTNWVLLDPAGRDPDGYHYSALPCHISAVKEEMRVLDGQRESLRYEWYRRKRRALRILLDNLFTAREYVGWDHEIFDVSDCDDDGAYSSANEQTWDDLPEVNWGSEGEERLPQRRRSKRPRQEIVYSDRKRPRHDIDPDLLLHLVADGYPVARIAELLCVSQSTIRRRCEAEGIDLVDRRMSRAIIEQNAADSRRAVSPEPVPAYLVPPDLSALATTPELAKAIDEYMTSLVRYELCTPAERGEYPTAPLLSEGTTKAVERFVIPLLRRTFRAAFATIDDDD